MLIVLIIKNNLLRSKSFEAEVDLKIMVAQTAKKKEK